MTMRSSKKTVTFNKPFNLTGTDETLPAGAYCVETDEELLAGVSFPVYRRVATRMHVHPTPGVAQVLIIDPDELDAALKLDAGASR